MIKHDRTITVKVLDQYNGCTGKIVDTITRKYTVRRSLRGIRDRKFVKYCGGVYEVFQLPESYGSLAGSCINITRRY